MDMSARLFGVNSWSILVPQALEGVAAVGVLYATVRRWFSPGAALMAGAVMALTPVAALMFRFNNPDALLVLLLTLGAYAMVRAPRGRAHPLARLRVHPRRVRVPVQDAPGVPRAACVRARVLGGRPDPALPPDRPTGVGWCSLCSSPPGGGSPSSNSSRPPPGPTSEARPTTASSTCCSATTASGASPATRRAASGAVPRAGSRWGATGLGRLFGSEMGGQAAWLLPAALILLVAGIAARRLLPRTDRTRAALLLWGGWLLVTGLTFSLGEGIIHPYYTVALAPAIGAIVGIGVSTWWQRRHEILARVVLGATLAVTAVWSYTLLQRTPTWLPWLSTLVMVGGVAVAVLVLAVPRLRGRFAVAVGAAALVIALAGPTAYSLSTASTSHGGAIPSAGPATGFGFPGPGGPGRGAFRPFPGGNPPAGVVPPGAAGGTLRPGGFAGRAPTFPGGGTTGTRRSGGFGGGGRGGIGGLLNGSTPSAALVKVLEKNSSSFTWVAAAVGSNEAAGYQLATGKPVMAIGGFNGSDPTPTLAQFKQYVAAGRIHYFVGGGGFGGRAPQGTTSSTSAAITSWVTTTFTAKTVGAVTIYDLSTS